MINITRIKPIQNKFLSFFMEADDDEEEKPARKMKVISVKPDNRSKKFDNVINKAKENEDTESDNEDDMELVDDMDEDEMPDTDDPMDDDSSDESNNDSENTDSETSDTSDNTETGQNESENSSDEEQNNLSNDDEGPNTDDPMDDSDEIDELSDSIDEDIKKENNNSESNNTDEDSDNSDNSNGPDTTDPMDDGDESSESDNSTNSTDTSNTSGENEGAGIDYDSMRKYNLFKNFISLYYGIDKYLDHIEAMIKDDPESNTVINDCIKRLHELKQLTYDYIIIKYNPAPYVQSMLFYQRLVASIEIIFKLLSSLNVKKEKPKKEKDNKKV